MVIQAIAEGSQQLRVGGLQVGYQGHTHARAAGKALLAWRDSGFRIPGLGWRFLWIIVAMVAARSAAMTINRIADLRYDKENPRTKMRALATGELSVSFAWTFALIAD